jgi:hypothetical protein
MVGLIALFFWRKRMKESPSKILMIIPIALVLVLAHSALMAQDAKPFVGTWNGALNLVGQELEIIVELSLNESNNLQGNIDVPAQGATDIPLGEFNIEGKKISFKIIHAQVQGDPTFNGELNESGKIIAGEYSQGGATGTFSVEKQ